MKPIFILSKGRPECPTAKLLTEAGIKFTLVIEPQDLDRYNLNFPNAMFGILLENNQGITYVRNKILESAVAQINNDWIWVLDDDIEAFYISKNKKCIKINPQEALEESEKFIIQDGVAQGALEYQQFAWARKNDYVKNSYCDVAVLINLNLTNLIRYRKEVELKEDRDFTLQILSNGFNTIRVQKYAFSVPKNGTNEGGLYDTYKQGKELNSTNKMIEFWGDKICSLNVKSDGRPDCKINWRMFK